MKKLAFLFLSIIFTVYSCNKSEDANLEKNAISDNGIELTVQELYVYCETNGEYPCNEPLNHEGDSVVVVGYYKVSSHTYNMSENKFSFYNTSERGSINIEMTVAENYHSIFYNITDFINEDTTAEYLKLKVRGNIYGQDLPINGYCSRGIFIEITSLTAIQTE